MQAPSRVAACSAAHLAFLAAIVLSPAFGVAQPVGEVTPSSTQQSRHYSSSYLSLDSWCYPYIDLLVARGKLAGLSPFLRPYRRIDVARAVLDAAREARLEPAEREWLSLLEHELERELGLLRGGAAQDVGFHATVGAGLDAMTHTHRDPLRPEGAGKIFPTLLLDLSGEAPAVAGALTLRWNGHYLNDPQFPAGRAIPDRQCDPLIDECAYRVEEAYVELQLPYVRAFFGRMYRNWGLAGGEGYLVSDYAYSYEHIGYRFGSERIALSGFFTTFNDFGGDTARYFSTHRFDWQLRENLVLAVGESVIYGGENRRLDLSLTNPIGVWELEGEQAGEGMNVLGSAELWWRPFSKFLAYGVFMVDNTKVGDEEGTKDGLTQYAAGLGFQLLALRPNLALRADFTLVNSLAYRSRVAFYEYYAVGAAGWGLGLAHDKTDAISLAVAGDWFVRARVLLRPQLAILWKGEDNITDPWPADAFTEHPGLLVGVVETTVRPALAGLLCLPFGDLRWDLGLNLIDNQDHEEKGWVVKVVGRALFEVRYRF